MKKIDKITGEVLEKKTDFFRQTVNGLIDTITDQDYYIFELQNEIDKLIRKIEKNKKNNYK